MFLALSESKFLATWKQKNFAYPENNRFFFSYRGIRLRNTPPTNCSQNLLVVKHHSPENMRGKIYLRL